MTVGDIVKVTMSGRVRKAVATDVEPFKVVTQFLYGSRSNGRTGYAFLHAIVEDLLAYDLAGKQPSDFPLLAHLVDDDRLDEADDLLGRARDLQSAI
ncbi:MAG: hypothetical protein M0R06_22375 [Sphaerochaeta sp.]|jgi:hypothetical protein|nr:hypothetical protein [Sphaerochaeta sp.]